MAVQTVSLACGHDAEVTHERGERRVPCGCGRVTNVVADPVTVTTYRVFDITPPPPGDGSGAAA